jgi:hypothetical protein
MKSETMNWVREHMHLKNMYEMDKKRGIVESPFLEGYYKALETMIQKEGIEL